ncbi:Rad9-domain-containing protein [Catenaria anguillulae PL171]|uniref:Rad9-domain-containing protein n=1 Tax=Catenaria anguillulae PL171 TaxID=765915 RepID=A0A1Y2HTV5_9FUNG|nr:Rad9-domain-containing protein [Catenaria anguillulae PL171]
MTRLPPTLDAHLAGDDLRHFFKVLQMLHKIGNDLFIEATPTRFHVSALNDHKSAFAIANFSPLFFSRYSVTPASSAGPAPQSANTRGTPTPPTEPTLQCCLPLAPLIAIFKGKAPTSSHAKSSPMLPSPSASTTTAVGNPLPSTSTRVSRATSALSTHSCRLLTTPTSLTLRFHASPTDLTSHKSFTLHLTNTGAHPRPVYTKSSCPHIWSVRPEHLAAIAMHFHPRIDDIILRCERDRVVWKTVPPDAPEVTAASAAAAGTGGEAVASAALETTVEMAVEDLEPYLVQIPETPVAASTGSATAAAPAANGQTQNVQAGAVEVCFGWREFKATLALAEAIGERITAHLSGPGGAIIFALEKPELYHMDVVLATVQDDAMPMSRPIPAAPPQTAPQQLAQQCPSTHYSPAQSPSHQHPSPQHQQDPFAFPSRGAPPPPAQSASGLATIPPLTAAQLANLRTSRTTTTMATAAATHAPALAPADPRSAAFPFTTPRSPAAPARSTDVGVARLPTLGDSFHHDSMTTAGTVTPDRSLGVGAQGPQGWLAQDAGGFQAQMDARWAASRAVTPASASETDEEGDDEDVPPTPPAAKRARLMF